MVYYNSSAYCPLWFNAAASEQRSGRVTVFAETNRQSEPGLTELYQRHRRWLISAVRRRGGGELSEDIAQEAFLRIERYERRGTIAHPKALLLQVARNILRAHRRSERTVKNSPPVYIPGTTTEVAAADQEHLVLLRQVILTLPEAYRDVFVMQRFGGMSYEAIAQHFGITVKAVEWRMTRAMALCAAALRD